MTDDERVGEVLNGQTRLWRFAAEEQSGSSYTATDFFGSEYFAPNMSLQRLSLEDYARGRERRLAECRRLIGF